MKVFVTARAEDDLNALRHWIREDNPERADSFIDEIEARIAGLAEWPERFPVAYTSKRGPVRRLVHRRYRILFAVLRDRVEILVVHHGARNSEKHL